MFITAFQLKEDTKTGRLIKLSPANITEFLPQEKSIKEIIAPPISKDTVKRNLKFSCKHKHRRSSKKLCFHLGGGGGGGVVGKLCLTLGTQWTVAHQAPPSSIEGISQARILEWVAISFSKGSSWPRGQTGVSSIAGRFFTNWTTRKAPPYIRLNLRRWPDICFVCSSGVSTN